MALKHQPVGVAVQSASQGGGDFGQPRGRAQDLDGQATRRRGVKRSRALRFRFRGASSAGGLAKPSRLAICRHIRFNGIR